MRNYYICRYYFNASHSFRGDREKIHTHTFTVVLYVGKRKEEKESDVKLVDIFMDRFLKRYEGEYLNDLPEFKGKDASLEDIGDAFYEAFKTQLRATNFSLYQLDISDNPLSVYRIGDRILLPILNLDNSRENYDTILKQKQLEEMNKR